MRGAWVRWRIVVAAAVGVTCAVVIGAPPAFALNPALDVSQYAHTAWRYREGFARGVIVSIAQTPDGYLWLASDFGVFRFDGVRAVAWEPPPGQALPSNEVVRLLAARDGSLWIGTSNGLARWKDGALTAFAPLAGHVVYRLLEDRDGTIWTGTIALGDAQLCAIRGTAIECYGGGGRFGNIVVGLHEDQSGALWLGVLNGVWRWRPGPPTFYPVPAGFDSIQGFAEDDGGLLLTVASGVRRLVDGKVEPYSLPGVAREFRGSRLLRDRDGDLWIGTGDQGLLHQHQGRTDAFTVTDGLSGDAVYDIFEDREGSIWVATPNGLDRFRDVAVATFGASHGVSSVQSVLAARDGSIWFGANGVLHRRKSPQAMHVAIDHVTPEGTRIALPNSLFQDRRGRIWVSALAGVGYFENGQFTRQGGVPGGSAVHGIAEDTDGNVWIANQKDGLFRVAPDGTIRQLSWVARGRNDFISALVADPARGGLWIGFYEGGLVYFKDGQVRETYTSAAGLGKGRVNNLRLDRQGALWVATAGGVSRLSNGRVATLTRSHGLPCDGAHWTIEDDARALWLLIPCALARIPAAEWGAWAASAEKGHARSEAFQATFFDHSDGVAPRAGAGGYSPQVAKDPDGRIWFIDTDGVSVVDPRHLPVNTLAPPVRVEGITADRQRYDVAAAASSTLQLPALTKDLQIDYTALSFVAPEKMQFRYRLEGRDPDWQAVGTRRQAFYDNLPPGTYRFRVVASNDSGVWNEAGASLAFAIAPAYYQTTWFRLLAAGALVAVLAAGYRYRIRRVARHFNLRLEARVEERTRIARDFHDTLLQSFQGVLLKFHATTYLLPNRPDEALEMLHAVIDQASRAIAEGRDAVQGLRTSTLPATDLASAIGLLGEQLVADHGGPQGPTLHVDVEGVVRDLAPLVQDEVYRIAGEALRNAFRHAAARRIEVEVRYEPRRFRLRVRDDGKGINPAVLGGDGRGRHFGLAGMQERTHVVGGKLAVWSELDSGSEIELTIPAAVAYAKPPAARR